MLLTLLGSWLLALPAHGLPSTRHVLALEPAKVNLTNLGVEEVKAMLDRALGLDDEHRPFRLILDGTNGLWDPSVYSHHRTILTVRTLMSSFFVTVSSWPQVNVESRVESQSFPIKMRIGFSTALMKPTTPQWQAVASIHSGANGVVGKIGSYRIPPRRPGSKIGSRHESHTFICPPWHRCAIQTLTWHATISGICRVQVQGFFDSHVSTDVCSAGHKQHHFPEEIASVTSRWCPETNVDKRCSFDTPIMENGKPLSEVRFRETPLFKNGKPLSEVRFREATLIDNGKSLSEVFFTGPSARPAESRHFSGADGAPVLHHHSNNGLGFSRAPNTILGRPQADASHDPVDLVQINSLVDEEVDGHQVEGNNAIYKPPPVRHMDVVTPHLLEDPRWYELDGYQSRHDTEPSKFYMEKNRHGHAELSMPEPYHDDVDIGQGRHEKPDSGQDDGGEPDSNQSQEEQSDGQGYHEEPGSYHSYHEEEPVGHQLEIGKALHEEERGGMQGVSAARVDYGKDWSTGQVHGAGTGRDPTNRDGPRTLTRSRTIRKLGLAETAVRKVLKIKVPPRRNRS